MKIYCIVSKDIHGLRSEIHSMFKTKKSAETQLTIEANMEEYTKGPDGEYIDEWGNKLSIDIWDTLD